MNFLVHGDRESYDDDNPPRGKLDRRPSNWNMKDCQPWPLSAGCPLLRPSLVLSASADRVATEGLTDLLLEHPSTLALGYQNMQKILQSDQIFLMAGTSYPCACGASVVYLAEQHATQQLLLVESFQCSAESDTPYRLTRPQECHTTTSSFVAWVSESANGRTAVIDASFLGICPPSD